MRLWRRLALAMAVPVAAVLFYAGAGFGLGAIATSDPPPSGPIELAIASNPFHTDLVLPAEGWREELGLPPEAQYIVVGWGALSFYAETPQISDLKLSTVLKALSGNDAATLHVTWLPGKVLLGGDVHPLPVTAAQAASLAAYVREWFDGPAPERIPGLSYGFGDMFFKAKGHWTPLTTCNEWLAQGLRRAGIRTGLWAPFAPGVTAHLPA